MKNLKYLGVSLAVSLILTITIGNGAVTRPDKWVQDSLYQSGSIPSTDIVIIGIDEHALAELGPYNTWDRNVMSSALEQLASDPDNMPAVVAIDTMYIGHTTEEADTRLVNAVSALPNAVVASAAQFGTSYEYDGISTSANYYSVINYETPFEELSAVATIGHINAMEDLDGIMRHALLYVKPDSDTKVYSMAYETARLYLESTGSSITDPDTNSRGQFYVPFTAGPSTYYDGYSLTDLINGVISPSYYADKIVLIGPYATGLQDAYFTPIDRSSQMFGVEFQANVIQSYLDSNYKQELSDIPQLILLFAITAILTYVFLSSNTLTNSVITVVTLAISFIVPMVLYSNGTVVHVIWFPVVIFISFLIGLTNRFRIASNDRKNITRSFERYVAPNIVKEILKSNSKDSSVGKTCEVAVLFVDVRGFTTMSERLDPETVVYILNKYLSKVVDCIDTHNGTLDKFVGDAVMAFWGAPLPDDNSSEHACRAALDIVKGVASVSEELEAELGEKINVGVGVHYGKAVVGNMGSSRRMDYTAIGDTVNTAARLESNAPAGKVYISRVVADKLGDKASTTSLGTSVKLKGKADGFEVLELTGLEE